MKVKYIKERDDWYELDESLVYEVKAIARGWYLIDDGNGDWLYPPGIFDVVENDPAPHEEMVQHDHLLNFLYDASKDQMVNMICPDCGAPISFNYCEKYGTFSYCCDCGGTRSLGCGYKPNCAIFFGNKHTFQA